MKNYHNSIPRFGTFASLLNEKVRPEIATLNDLHFNNFFKRCLIHSGFVSIIRYNYDEILYLKLYYFTNKAKDNKREIEQFVSSYYLHEKDQLKYTKCNIIRIPLKIEIDEELIQAQNDISSLESLLHHQLTEKSWVGVDFTGTSGGLTIGVNHDHSIHLQRKNLFDKVYIDTSYEIEMNNSLEINDSSKREIWTRITTKDDGLNISISPSMIVLSWSSVPIDVQVSHTIKLKWNGIQIRLTVMEYYGQRSNTLRALVECSNEIYNFGVGRSSVGAGSMGKIPNIVFGNNKLKFQFGKNSISILDMIIDQSAELIEKKNESNFQIEL
jgi:hypothetical protein